MLTFWRKLLEAAVGERMLKVSSLSGSTRVDEFLNTPKFNEKSNSY